MNVLELGTNVAPAFAGMVLAEQGHHVTKWVTHDPMWRNARGQELFGWLNTRKNVVRGDARDVTAEKAAGFDIVLDNFRASAWERWQIDPDGICAAVGGLRWVSLRDDFDGRSFDVIAQARAWGDLTPPVPFYLGDTAAGLWMAFVAVSSAPGHHVLRHAAVLAKMVEGELDPRRDGQRYPYNTPGAYGLSDDGSSVQVRYGDQLLSEPLRGPGWRRQHILNEGGHIVVESPQPQPPGRCDR